MAGTTKKQLSDGELSDDNGEEDLDTSNCKTCNLTFTNSKAFYHHIYSVSHLQNTSKLKGSAEPTLSVSSVSSATPRSSFPVDALYAPTPFSPPQEDQQEEDEDPLYMFSQFEPLVEGQWVMGEWRPEESGMLYGCEMCGVVYNEKLMIDLHLAGLRHMKNVEATEAASSVLESASEKMKLNDVVQRNVDLSQQPEGVKSEQTEAQDKRVKVADILSRNVNAYQKLSLYVEPVLGVDYVSEFRHSSGQVEHVCNLCEASPGSSIMTHCSSLTHLLRYIYSLNLVVAVCNVCGQFYHDSNSFKLISLADKCSDLEFVRTIAADIESKQGRQLSTRVFTESASTPDNENSQDSTSNKWVEQQCDPIRPVTDLPGHSANMTYGFKRPPDDTMAVRDVQSLLDTLTYQSSVASSRPPGSVRPVTRMDLLASLAAFEISNDSDAEVSLQIANSLTLALLSYRTKSIPALKVSDRAKLEQKLMKLREEAEVVAEKTRCRHIAAAADHDTALS